MTRRPRTLAAALAAVACSLVLASCSNHAATGPTTIPTSGPTTGPTGPPTTGSTAKSAAGLTWVLSKAALAHIATDPTALGIVEAGKIYELVTAGSRPVPGVNAVLTEDFASYAAMSQAVQSGALVQGVQALLYDPENWSHTPAAEQAGVRSYLQQAIALAHSHGLQIVLTPALDLVRVLAPGPQGGLAEVTRFLATGVEAAAAGADVVDVQAQGMERNTPTYSYFVKGAVGQIHGRDASTVVIAGLSTNPATGPVTSSDLVQAIGSVAGVAGGYWLNMPAKSSFCPSCSNDVNWQAGTSALDSVWS